MKKRPNTGELPEARAQVEGPQIKNICITGLKVLKTFFFTLVKACCKPFNVTKA
jgi:hypothetical protein